jgi:hypothetical protein
MGIAVSFVGYTPPARYDATPWTDVQIEEAATEDGTYALIDTLSLGTPDPDPSNPASRNFTTANGTAADQWYRVIFVDAVSTTSEPSEPIQNSPLAIGADPYASVDALASMLNIREPQKTLRTTDLERVLRAAAGEINSEIGAVNGDLSGWQLDLAIQVNLDRAADLWRHSESVPGLVGIPDEVMPTTVFGRYSWERYAQRLAPLKQSWGLA